MAGISEIYFNPATQGAIFPLEKSRPEIFKAIQIADI